MLIRHSPISVGNEGESTQCLDSILWKIPETLASWHTLMPVRPQPLSVSFSILELITEIDNDSFASRFADSICRCYLEINFTADNNYDLIINAINLCTSWELKIRSINRINQILTYSKSRETQMIASLGGEYLKLNTTYGAASFDINEHNRELLSFLKSNRHFVSEFKERDNQFKVSFLHSC